MKRSTKTITLDMELWRKLKVKSAECNLTMTEIAEYYIKEGLAREQDLRETIVRNLKLEKEIKKMQKNGGK
ncbi:MAG: hypothetical protein PHS33_08780 [Candidatus Omnitrophica bacterium]|nr:hypothetical protein [Candidatus Omnitrophota bacterium]MDD5219824.1 hypothetical protein [Candidatus Bipolaricaulis sp.]